MLAIEVWAWNMRGLYFFAYKPDFREAQQKAWSRTGLVEIEAGISVKGKASGTSRNFGGTIIECVVPFFIRDGMFWTILAETVRFL